MRPISSRFRPLPPVRAVLTAVTLLAWGALACPDVAWAQAGSSPRPAPGSGSPSVRLEFPDAPVATILPFYETLTGKKIVRDANLTGSNLSVVSDQMLTRGEAAAFIESVLLLNGYAFVPMDATTLKLVNYAGGKNVRGMGLPVITSERDLPDTDSIVNYILPLDHLSPDAAVQAFSQVVTLNPYGNITPMPNSGSLVITENTSVIRSLIKLKNHVDVPPAQVTNQFIQLKRADATNIAEIINSVFEAREGLSGGGASVSGTPAEAGAAALSAAGNGRALVVPYRRTNSLLVIARPADLSYIEGLVETFDKPSGGVNFLKRRLEHVSVLDYLQTFYNALAMSTDIEPANGQGAPGGGSDATAGTSTSPALASLASADTTAFGSGSGGTTGTGAPRTADRLGEPRENGAPQSFVVGNTLLIADPNANSLIVSGSPEHLETVGKLIGEIDQPQHQVYLSTIIGQLSLGDEMRYGLNALQTLQEFQTSDEPIHAAGSLMNGVATVADIASLAETAAFPATAGLNLYGKMNWGSTGSLNAFLRLQAKDSRFRILSRPSIYAQNNSKAMISSGQRIAVPVSTLTSVGNGIGGQFPGSIASNIEYRDVVLKLEVIPLINSDNEVTLDIAQVNDNVVGTQIIGENEIPILNTQEFRTKITVRNGDTIVLGGLITERQEKTRTGLPIVRRIPVIGRVLGSTDKTTEREELLIFLQPHIVPTNQRPVGTNDLERQRTTILDEALEFADPQLEPTAVVRPAKPWTRKMP